MHKLTAMPNYVILEAPEKKGEHELIGGIMVPIKVGEDKFSKAKVHSVGACEDCEIRPGDQVWINKYSAQDFSFEGKDYLFLAYDSIIAKVE